MLAQGGLDATIDRRRLLAAAALHDFSARAARASAERADADRSLLIAEGVHGFGVENEDAAALVADFFVASAHKRLFAPCGSVRAARGGSMGLDSGIL